MDQTTPVRSLYTPPDGYEDIPFTWVFDANALVDGTDALNQYVYILGGGWGDFVMRRIVGLGSVLNPAGGAYLIRDSQKRPMSSEPILLEAVQDDLMLPNEVFYPETSIIGFDLFDVLKAT